MRTPLSSFDTSLNASPTAMYHVLV